MRRCACASGAHCSPGTRSCKPRGGCSPSAGTPAPACGTSPGAAGVSAQTVYDSVGSKQALVAGLNDLIDSEAGIGAIVRAAAEADHPRELMATPSRITRAILEHCGDIVRALVSGAAAEPELAAVLAEGQRRHLAGVARIVAELERLEALDPAVDAGDAVETLAALSDVRFALVLHKSYGWPLDRLESWIAATSRALLLADSAHGDAG